MNSNSIRIGWTAVAFAALIIIVGCSTKNDAVSQAEKADKINGIAVPGIEETKARLPKRVSSTVYRS